MRVFLVNFDRLFLSLGLAALRTGPTFEKSPKSLFGNNFVAQLKMFPSSFSTGNSMCLFFFRISYTTEKEF